MATKKQIAAAKRNIKKAQAAQRKKSGGGGKKKKSAKRSGVSRAGMGPFQKGIKDVRGITKPATDAMVGYGMANPVITVLTGRNLMHPAGGLHQTAQTEVTTLPAVGNIPARDANLVMYDNLGVLFGDDAAAISGETLPSAMTVGERLRNTWRGTRYNAKSAFTGDGGRLTTWGPLGVALGARMAENLLMPAAERAARAVDKALKPLGVK